MNKIRCGDTTSFLGSSSDLAEDSDIDGLDFIFEGFDFLLEVIGGDLLILNDATNDELVDSVGNGFLLVF